MATMVAMIGKLTQNSNAECLIKGKDYAAFQLYVKTPANVTCLLPSEMTMEQGCVLPLAVNTASHGLFGEGYLNLPRPSLNPQETDTAVFIYGGSTSVGMCSKAPRFKLR